MNLCCFRNTASEVRTLQPMAWVHGVALQAGAVGTECLAALGCTRALYGVDGQSNQYGAGEDNQGYIIENAFQHGIRVLLYCSCSVFRWLNVSAADFVAIDASRDLCGKQST